MSGRAWRGVVVAIAAVALVEAARRLGVSLPDMTALYLLAVVYAALDGGVWVGLAGVFVTFGHALVTTGGAPGTYALAVVAPATVAVATLLTADAARELPPPVEATSEPAMADRDTVQIEREPGTLAFTAMSDNAEPVLGVPAEHALANAELWTSGLHPADRARVHAAYETLKNRPAECTITYRVLSADAGFIPVREALRPHRALPGGRVLKLVGTITRLTEPEAHAPAAAVPAAGPTTAPRSHE